jgi:transcription antitermination factor NusG
MDLFGSNSQTWFALRVRSNCEKVVATSLACKGYPQFLPTRKRRSRRDGTTKDVDVALFPGYVFGAFDVNQRLPIVMIPGVVHIVGVGLTPEPIDPKELLAVERFVSSGMAVELWPFLKTGESVLVERGPLTGLEGLLVQIKNSNRLVISLSLLQRSVAVEIDRECVRPLPKPVTAPVHAGAQGG